LNPKYYWTDYLGNTLSWSGKLRFNHILFSCLLNLSVKWVVF